MGHDLARLAEHMATSQASLLHGGARQGGESDHIAGRIDMRNTRLKVLVHCQLAASISSQSSRFDVHLVAVGLASDGVQQSLPADNLAALQLGEHPITFLVKTDLHHLFAQPEHSS